MESHPLQQIPLEEPVILKSIDEQIEEEERARGGTIKMNGPAQNGLFNEVEQPDGLKFNELEEEKGPA